MKPACIHIRDGLHRGAEIDLSGRDAWHFGATESADIVITDDGIPESGFTLRAADSGEWLLACSHDALRFDGIAVPKDTEVRLVSGATFTVGPVTFLFAGSLDGDATQRSQASARRAVLRQVDKRSYYKAVVADMRPSLIVLGWIATGAVACIGATAVMLHPSESRVERSGPWSAYITKAFPSVRVSVDPVSGLATYTGYVESQVELDHLRSVAAAVDKGKTIVRVVPMDTLALHAELFLDEFYSSVAVQADGMGGIAATMPDASAMKALGSWDFEQVSRRLRKAIPDIQAARFNLAESSGRRVPIPWKESGYSVVTTPGAVPVAVDKAGIRLFRGASLEEGTIGRLDHCAIEVAGKQASLFRFERSDAAGCMQANASTRTFD